MDQLGPNDGRSVSCCACLALASLSYLRRERISKADATVLIHITAGEVRAHRCAVAGGRKPRSGSIELDAEHPAALDVAAVGDAELDVLGMDAALAPLVPFQLRRAGGSCMDGAVLESDAIDVLGLGAAS